jgi:hypothetical protein
VGEDPASTERQLHRWRFHPAIAHDALRWAVEQHARSVVTAATGAPDRSSDPDGVVMLRHPLAAQLSTAADEGSPGTSAG